MNRLHLLKCATTCVIVFLAMACNQSTADKIADVKTDSTQAMAISTDPAKLKAEIQEQETAWAAADNARDINTLAAFYSNDAVSLANNQPMLVGNAAITKDLEISMAKRPKGSTTTYDVMDAYGGGNYVTETGKITRKDSTGKITSTGKYMAIWEKSEGKWSCIRDISNDDAKEK